MIYICQVKQRKQPLTPTTMSTAAQVQIVAHSDIHAMTNGLLVVKSGNSFVVEYHFGAGERPLVYDRVSTERRAMNAVARLIKCDPRMVVSFKTMSVVK